MLTAIFGGFRRRAARVARAAGRPHVRAHSRTRRRALARGRAPQGPAAVRGLRRRGCVRGLHLWRARPQRRTGGAPNRHRTKIETKVHPRGGGGPSPRRRNSYPTPGPTTYPLTRARARTHKHTRAFVYECVSRFTCVRVCSLITLGAIVFVPAFSSCYTSVCVLRAAEGFNPFYYGQKDYYIYSSPPLPPLAYFFFFNEISGPHSDPRSFFSDLTVASSDRTRA